MEVIQLPALFDNYIYLLIGKAGSTAVVDAGVAGPVIQELERQGKKLDFIFNTHHHRDHVGANLELKQRYGCEIFGNAKDAARIPGIDRQLQAGEEFSFDGERVVVIPADGHTVGHILFWFPEAKKLFCGDTVFSLGCGKLFEGSAQQMWDTLERVRALPQDSILYCAHEYTLENALFALRADPDNPELRARVAAAEILREHGDPTVPMILSAELATNPFLRPESPVLQAFVNKEGAPLREIFGALRAAKDRFDSGEEI